MAKRTFREEPTGWNRSRAAERNHNSRTCGGSIERRWLRRSNPFARFNRRILRRGDFRRCDHCAILRPTND